MPMFATHKKLPEGERRDLPDSIVGLTFRAAIPDL